MRLSLLQKLENAHEDSVWTAAWAPDGDTLVTGSVDESVKLWNEAGDTLEQKHQLVGGHGSSEKGRGQPSRRRRHRRRRCLGALAYCVPCLWLAPHCVQYSARPRHGGLHMSRWHQLMALARVIELLAARSRCHAPPGCSRPCPPMCPCRCMHGACTHAHPPRSPAHSVPNPIPTLSAPTPTP